MILLIIKVVALVYDSICVDQNDNHYVVFVSFKGCVGKGAIRNRKLQLFCYDTSRGLR